MRKILLIYLIISFGIHDARAQQIPDIYYDRAITSSMMSQLAYQKPFPDLERNLGLSGWEWKHRSDNSGLKWTIFNRTLDNGKKEYVISFAGTELDPIDIRDLSTDINQFASVMPIPDIQYINALNVATKYISQADNSKDISVSFTGHSLGGGLAQYVSLNTGAEAFVFNSATLGLSSRWDFNKQQREVLAHNNIINIRLKGDIVSALPGLQLGQLIELEMPNHTGQMNLGSYHTMTNLITSIKQNQSNFYDQYQNHKNFNRHPLQQPTSTMEDYRDVIGLMKDFETIGNELNWINSKGGGNVITYGNAKNVLDGIISFSHDLQNAKNPQDWVRGESMQKLTEIGFDIFIEKMKEDAARSLGIKSMPTFGLDEVIHAKRKELVKGSTDIDVITSYLDATVGLTWGILGYTQTMLSTGNHQLAMTTANTYENTGKALASAGRFGMEKLMQKYYVNKTEMKAQFIEMYTTTNYRRMRNGQFQLKLSEMYDPNVLGEIFNKNEINEINQNAINSNIHLRQSRSNISIRNIDTDPVIMKMSINNLREIDQFESKPLIVGTKNSLDRLNYNGNNYRFTMETSGTLSRDIMSAKRYGFNTVIYVDDIEVTTDNYTPTTYSPNYNISMPNREYDKEVYKRRDEYPVIINTWLPPPPPPPPPVPIDPPDPPGGEGSGGSGGPPKYNGGGGATQLLSNIGGVMLSNVAIVDPTISQNTGKGDFSFIFKGKDPILDLNQYKKFCTSLWSVYFDPTPPGISIDPISNDPELVDVQMVRYIGNVINNDLGRVMREADYKMKKWAVGTETPGINGFKNVDELMANSNINYFGASRRFWFVPEGMHFTTGDGYCIFTGGKMTLKTEYIFLDNKKVKAEPADIAFATFFTENYNEIASKYPIYQELYDYAKYVSLAHYLKQNKIPLLWFLLANKHFIDYEESPGTVKQLVKGSKYFKGTKIVGGVNPNVPKGNYIYDTKAINAINEVVKSNWNRSSDQNQPAITTSKEPITIEIENNELTLVDEYALTSGYDLLGNKYQTDLSIWEGDEPGLEITRVSSYEFSSPSEFGYSWAFLKPYQVNILSNDSVISGDYIWSKYCTISNIVTSEIDTLIFTPDKYNYMGYCPIDTSKSEFILLMPLTDGSFQLGDKLGNYYAFNTDGDLKEMVLGNLREDHWDYYFEDCDPENNTEIPMSIELGDNRIEFGQYNVVDNIKVVDNVSKTKHTFNIDQSSNFIEYKVQGESIYDKIVPLNNGKYLLTNLQGGKYYFDEYGCLSETFSGKEYKIEYEYFEDGIDDFTEIPYNLNKASNETVTVELGNYELFLPKKMSIIDLNQGTTVLFEFIDTDTCVCYVTKNKNSTLKSLHYLTNGFYMAVTKSGSKLYFNEAGNFYSIVSYGRNFLKSVKQGDYIAEFKYTIVADGLPVVDKIKIYKDLEWELVYELTYEYDINGLMTESKIIYAEK